MNFPVVISGSPHFYRIAQQSFKELKKGLRVNIVVESSNEVLGIQTTKLSCLIKEKPNTKGKLFLLTLYSGNEGWYLHYDDKETKTVLQTVDVVRKVKLQEKKKR